MLSSAGSVPWGGHHVRPSSARVAIPPAARRGLPRRRRAASAAGRRDRALGRARSRRGRGHAELVGRNRAVPGLPGAARGHRARSAEPARHHAGDDAGRRAAGRPERLLPRRRPGPAGDPVDHAAGRVVRRERRDLRPELRDRPRAGAGALQLHRPPQRRNADDRPGGLRGRGDADRPGRPDGHAQRDQPGPGDRQQRLLAAGGLPRRTAAARSDAGCGRQRDRGVHRRAGRAAGAVRRQARSLVRPDRPAPAVGGPALPRRHDRDARRGRHDARRPDGAGRGRPGGDRLHPGHAELPGPAAAGARRPGCAARQPARLDHVRGAGGPRRRARHRRRAEHHRRDPERRADRAERRLRAVDDRRDLQLRRRLAAGGRDLHGGGDGQHDRRTDPGRDRGRLDRDGRDRHRRAGRPGLRLPGRGRPAPAVGRRAAGGLRPGHDPGRGHAVAGLPQRLLQPLRLHPVVRDRDLLHPDRHRLHDPLHHGRRPADDLRGRRGEFPRLHRPRSGQRRRDLPLHRRRRLRARVGPRTARRPPAIELRGRDAGSGRPLLSPRVRSAALLGHAGHGAVARHDRADGRVHAAPGGRRGDQGDGAVRRGQAGDARHRGRPLHAAGPRHRQPGRVGRAASPGARRRPGAAVPRPAAGPDAGADRSRVRGRRGRAARHGLRDRSGAQCADAVGPAGVRGPDRAVRAGLPDPGGCDERPAPPDRGVARQQPAAVRRAALGRGAGRGAVPAARCGCSSPTPRRPTAASASRSRSPRPSPGPSCWARRPRRSRRTSRSGRTTPSTWPGSTPPAPCAALRSPRERRPRRAWWRSRHSPGQ